MREEAGAGVQGQRGAGKVGRTCFSLSEAITRPIYYVHLRQLLPQPFSFEESINGALLFFLSLSLSLSLPFFFSLRFADMLLLYFSPGLYIKSAGFLYDSSLGVVPPTGHHIIHETHNRICQNDRATYR